jgi:micrococcal nuclease
MRVPVPWMRHLSRVSPFLLAFLLVYPGVSLANKYRIIRIIDGDTIVVNYQCKYEKLRFLRVNTPESVHPDEKQNIPMGKVASDYTKTKLAGKFVDLEFEGPFRGRYGRLLAYVFVDGQNFNLDLVRQGLSPYYTKYGLSQKYDEQFRQAERYARKNKLGIWGDPKLTQKYLRLKSKWGQYRSQTNK